MHNLKLVLAAGLVGGCLGSGGDEAARTSELGGGPRGAVFTTLVDGSSVNKNIYAAKEDVYLDGGPSVHAPSSAAALSEGDYYFQVTDPSGKALLSTDDISCRRFAVSDDGVIVATYRGDGGCQHATGIDADHAELGAITVQLMPYLDTPNPGGEYKVWVTPVDEYSALLGVHGFIHSSTKTDNFKVRVTPPPPPAPACGDGNVDSGEACDDGNTTDGDGCSANCTIETPPPPPCCGDGNLDAGEACDDGNTSGGDGCSATCTIELPPPPAPCCGDGNLDAGEECDDGNTTDGDGCSATCTIEHVCPT